MALYDLLKFQRLVADENWAYLNTRRPERLKEKLDWSDDDVARMLLGLDHRDFQKTVLSCIVTAFPGTEFVDADQYEIHWDCDECQRKPYPMQGTVSLSLKLAIVTDRKGDVAAIVTLHISGEPS